MGTWRSSCRPAGEWRPWLLADTRTALYQCSCGLRARQSAWYWTIQFHKIHGKKAKIIFCCFIYNNLLHFNCHCAVIIAPAFESRSHGFDSQWSPSIKGPNTKHFWYDPFGVVSQVKIGARSNKCCVNQKPDSVTIDVGILVSHPSWIIFGLRYSNKHWHSSPLNAHTLTPDPYSS